MKKLEIALLVLFIIGAAAYIALDAAYLNTRVEAYKMFSGISRISSILFQVGWLIVFLINKKKR